MAPSFEVSFSEKTVPSSPYIGMLGILNTILYTITGVILGVLDSLKELVLDYLY